MRAREFVINVPITIKINGDGDPEIDVDDAKDDDELDSNPVMVPPLQQDIELKKASVGKNSPIIQGLTRDEKDADEEESGILFKR
jgi:hypothetical protein